MSLITYKFRLYPNNEQTTMINKTFGCVRFIYNKILADAKQTYEETGKSIFYQPTRYKKEFEWLKEVDSVALCYARLNLRTAYSNFFAKRSAEPTFKKKTDHNDSYQTLSASNAIRIINDRIRLPKIGIVKFIKHRNIEEGKIKTVTVSRKPSGRYYVSILVDSFEDKDYTLPKTGKSVGIDLGIHHFATLSDGTKIENPRMLERYLERLAILQQRVSSKEKGSNNREKARRKLAKMYEHIANYKKDFFDKLTYDLVKNHDKIVIEDLDVKSMLLDDSSNRKMQHNINRSIATVGFYNFRVMLDYKCKKYGKELIVANKYEATSQKCSCCGYKNTLVKDLKVRMWQCPECGAIHDRDVNAAKNLLSLVEDKVSLQGYVDPSANEIKESILPSEERKQIIEKHKNLGLSL